MGGGLGLGGDRGGNLGSRLLKFRTGEPPLGLPPRPKHAVSLGLRLGAG